MILRKVKFNKDFRTFKKDEEVCFKEQLTIITGENGSGKSTLISGIRTLFKSKWSMSNDSSLKGVLSIDQNKDEGKEQGFMLYLDSSSDLYKNSPEFDYDNMNLFLKCMASSSGEGLIEQLTNLYKNLKTMDVDIVVLDEPERGISIYNQRIIKSFISAMVMLNPTVQFIVVTHSEILMSLKKEVFSVSHKDFVSKDLYIEYMNREFKT